MKPVRCAIYTRKSSEEGLEQGFNSLDAQREACAAYILSQASEGWTALPDIYDDGGISGGTLERPALKRLLADVTAGKVDVIVVYKVDRLSRSLFDFAKLVEIFEKAGTSFVSITQSFNTTSSMGRLTLNMLLSFAQFEREVTAERIRDKIAASKAKGMFMGGVPPIGYCCDGRTLAIVELHAELIRDIYRRYLRLGSLRQLEEELKRDQILTPRRLLDSGREIGGVPFAYLQLRIILKSQLYLGLIPHKGETYPGLHDAIIARDLWDAVQAKFAAHQSGGGREAYRFTNSLLAGKVVDEAGEPLIPMHTAKRQAEGQGRKRYSYYVSRALHHGAADTGMRVPAREIEGVVIQRLAEAFDDPIELVSAASLDVAASDYDRLNASALLVAHRIRSREPDLIRELITAVRVLPRTVEIDCDRNRLAEVLCCQIGDADAVATLVVTTRLTRSGNAMRLIHGGKQPTVDPDRALVRLLVQARGYWAELRKGQLNISELAASRSIGAPYLTRVLRLAFLSPALVEAILAGRQPTEITAASLLHVGAISPIWTE